MRVTGIVAASLLGGVAFAVLFAWVMWSFVFSPADKVFWGMLLGIGSLSGQ